MPRGGRRHLQQAVDLSAPKLTQAVPQPMRDLLRAGGRARNNLCQGNHAFHPQLGGGRTAASPDPDLSGSSNNPASPATHPSAGRATALLGSNDVEPSCSLAAYRWAAASSALKNSATASFCLNWIK